MWAVSAVSPFLTEHRPMGLVRRKVDHNFPISTPSVYNPLSAQRAITHSAPLGISLSSKSRQNKSIFLKYRSLVLGPLAMLVL